METQPSKVEPALLETCNTACRGHFKLCALTLASGLPVSAPSGNRSRWRAHAAPALGWAPTRGMLHAREVGARARVRGGGSCLKAAARGGGVHAVHVRRAGHARAARPALAARRPARGACKARSRTGVSLVVARIMGDLWLSASASMPSHCSACGWRVRPYASSSRAPLPRIQRPQRASLRCTWDSRIDYRRHAKDSGAQKVRAAGSVSGGRAAGE